MLIFKQKKSPGWAIFEMLDNKVLALVYFPGAQAQVSSTLRGLTSVFEMGTGVTLSLEAPRLCYLANLDSHHPACKIAPPRGLTPLKHPAKGGQARLCYLA